MLSVLWGDCRVDTLRDLKLKSRTWSSGHRFYSSSVDLIG